MRRFLFLALLAPFPALAQQTDAQLWLQTNGSVEVGEDIRATAEAIGRFSDDAGGFSHAEIGGMITYTLPGGVEVSAGYRHVEDWDQGRALPNEERLRQMVVVPLGSGFAGRLRFEQRFNSRGGEVGVRLRPQLRFTEPLGGKGFALFATHEAFVNFNTTDWGQRQGYERMRNTAGLSVPLSKSLRADIGYLNQYRFGRDGARDRMDHVASFTLSFNVAHFSDGD